MDVEAGLTLTTTGMGAEATAEAFVAARRDARALTTYPGAPPRDFAAAYLIQKAAIGLWGEPVVGWKVGRVPDQQVAKLGANRLAGPIFASGLFDDAGGVIDMPVFAGGFAAVEAEFVAVLGGDPPTGQRHFTMEEADALVFAVHCGIEIASSPYPGINADGSAVTVSDFGNNHGLILGAQIDRAAMLDHPIRVEIDGETVGEKTAREMLDGPIGAVRFLLEAAAEHGLPLRRGALISTGAVTGVHQAPVGAEAAAIFSDTQTIRCRLVAAQATGETGK